MEEQKGQEKSAGALQLFFKDIAPTAVAIVALVLTYITTNSEREARTEDLIRSSSLEIDREVRLQKRDIMLKILHAANNCNRDCNVLAALRPATAEFRQATQKLRADLVILEDTGVDVDAALPKSVAGLVKPVYSAMVLELSHASQLVTDSASGILPDLAADDQKVLQEYAVLIAEIRRQLGADSGRTS